MPSRYKFTDIKLRGDGKRVFKPTMYPKIPIRDSDIFIYPRFGDRLDNLAYKYYNDVSLWWIIAKANNLDAAHIGLDVDKQIRIPMEITPILTKLDPRFGDRLDNLAYKYYGDVSLWWIIAKANNLDAAHIGLDVDNQIRIPMEITPILTKLEEMSY